MADKVPKAVESYKRQKLAVSFDCENLSGKSVTLRLDPRTVGYAGIFQILVIGSYATGKSTFLERPIESLRIDGERVKSYIHQYETDVGRHLLFLHELQMPHNHDLKYFKNMDGYFVLFELTSQPSYDRAVAWVDYIRKEVPIPESDRPIILLGTKVDQQTRRHVQIEDLANEWMAVQVMSGLTRRNFAYNEISALRNYNFFASFHAFFEGSLGQAVTIMEDQVQLADPEAGLEFDIGVQTAMMNMFWVGIAALLIPVAVLVAFLDLIRSVGGG